MNFSSVHSFHLYQHFLIVVTSSVPNVSSSVYNIFEIVMKLGLLNVNVLIEDKNVQVWSLHFYKPYVRNCDSFDTIVVETFSRENFTKALNVSFKNLFPSRKFKFHNCKLYVATFSLEPFVIIRRMANGTLEFDGIDCITVNEISATLYLEPIYINQTRGMVFKNGTATGAVKMV